MIKVLPIFQTAIPHTGNSVQLTRVPCKGELVQLPAGACEACCADVSVWVVRGVRHRADVAGGDVAAHVWIEPTRAAADAERAAQAAARSPGGGEGGSGHDGWRAVWTRCQLSIMLNCTGIEPMIRELRTRPCIWVSGRSRVYANE